jgi:hypothetical protein
MKRFLLLALCVPLLAVGGQVYAEGRAPAPVNSMGHMKVASTTTSHPEKSEKPEARKAIPGIVTSVSTTGFTMTGRSQGKDHATTTLTVVVTPTTVFKIRNSMEEGMKPGSMGSTTTGSTTPPVMATTTGSLSDVTVGSKLEVFGKVATSTNTITADKVHINRGKGEGKGSDKMEHGRPGMASGTPTMSDKKSFMQKLRDFIGGSSTGSTTSGGPAATGFIDFLSHALFGWFK